jgi:hypothetical protein
MYTGAVPPIQLEFTGLQPGSFTSGPNWSAPLFPRFNGSPLLITVVGVPVLKVKITPNYHSASACFLNPFQSFGVGIV